MSHHFEVKNENCVVEVDNFDHDNGEEIFLEVHEVTSIEGIRAVGILTPAEARELAEHLVIAAVVAEGVTA